MTRFCGSGASILHALDERRCRMGAALTYARRYALFTLVGIAGEDDLDAPNLLDAPRPSDVTSNGAGSLALPASAQNGKAPVHRRKPLSADQSKECCVELLGEIEMLLSAENAAAWAQRTLPVKNTMTSEDALAIELAFAAKISALESVPADITTPDHVNRLDEISRARATRRSSIDKGVLAIGEPRRYRDKVHLKFVSTQPCLICGRRPSDPHHLRFVQTRALARKVSDEFTVPLCRGHHREVHRSGDEKQWWERAHIEPVKAARKLWRKTRRNGSPGHADRGRDAATVRPADLDDGSGTSPTGGGPVPAPIGSESQ